LAVAGGAGFSQFFLGGGPARFGGGKHTEGSCFGLLGEKNLANRTKTGTNSAGSGFFLRVSLGRALPQGAARKKNTGRLHRSRWPQCFVSPRGPRKFHQGRWGGRTLPVFAGRGSEMGPQIGFPKSTGDNPGFRCFLAVLETSGKRGGIFRGWGAPLPFCSLGGNPVGGIPGLARNLTPTRRAGTVGPHTSAQGGRNVANGPSPLG